MPSICLYFQVHQPYRIKKYRIFDIGNDSSYFDHGGDDNLNNRKILEKVARKCYLPANKVLLEAIRKNPDFKISFSFSGVLLDQLQKYYPDVLESFRELVETGNVELLSETYYHSLSFLHSRPEFRKQVGLHRRKIKELFGKDPLVFRNTELIFNNDIACEAENLGFHGILAEGADHVLGWRSPNYIYRPKGTKYIKALLKNYKLSDDVAFRFSEKNWPEHPLTAEKYAAWLGALPADHQLINLFMDYETFGEHQWEDTGIFEFMKLLPEEVLKYPNLDFVTPTESLQKYSSDYELDVPDYISWADTERDLSAWLSNDMQQDAMKKVFEMEYEVLGTGDEQMIEDWRRLQTSDHFYYMCTKWFADGDVHKYFNPYQSPYEAFISYMNVLNDLKTRVLKSQESKSDKIQNTRNRNGRMSKKGVTPNLPFDS